MARDDKSISHRFLSLSSPHIVLVSSLRLVFASRCPVSFSLSIVSSFVLFPRLAIASRFLTSSSSAPIRVVIVSVISHPPPRPLIYPLITTSLPFPIASRIAPYHRIAFFSPCYGLIHIALSSLPDGKTS